MKDFIIKDQAYSETMEKTVVPELKRKEDVTLLEREQGRRIYCAGYKAENSRGIVLISHGFTETADKYLECIYYFLQMGFHTFCMEHCGHGRSYRLTEDLSLVHTDHYERYVKDLIFVAEYAKKICKNQPLILFGHSMGGGIAAACAAQRPELFAGVILSSPMIQPETRPVPWILAEIIAGFFTMTGKGMSYAAGQKPYRGPERFEDSASTSFARFDYYQKKRNANPLYQMSALSYGWLFSAAKLKHYLMREGWKYIQMPLLVFQAEQESFVSNKEIERFVKKVNQSGNAELVPVKHAKHEIYLSEEPVLKEYWEQIKAFCYFASTGKTPMPPV